MDTLLLGLALIVGIIASIIDIRKECIPNWLLIGGALVIIVTCLLVSASSLLSRALTALVVFVLFIVFYLILKKGLGMGDVKLIALIAFSFYFVGTWIVLITACLVALSWTLCRNLSHWNNDIAKKRIPFAPFLTLGMAVALFAKYKQLW
jgi:prepilin signal peptidase PulO-like enzyme (type II secretory pathway)